MSRRNILLLSNSTVHGTGYLEWAAQEIKDFLTRYVLLTLFYQLCLVKIYVGLFEILSCIYVSVYVRCQILGWTPFLPIF